MIASASLLEVKLRSSSHGSPQKPSKGFGKGELLGGSLDPRASRQRLAFRLSRKDTLTWLANGKTKNIQALQFRSAKPGHMSTLVQSGSFWTLSYLNKSRVSCQRGVCAICCVGRNSHIITHFSAKDAVACKKITRVHPTEVRHNLAVLTLQAASFAKSKVTLPTKGMPTAPIHHHTLD